MKATKAAGDLFLFAVKYSNTRFFIEMSDISSRLQYFKKISIDL